MYTFDFLMWANPGLLLQSFSTSSITAKIQRSSSISTCGLHPAGFEPTNSIFLLQRRVLYSCATSTAHWLVNSQQSVTPITVCSRAAFRIRIHFPRCITPTIHFEVVVRPSESLLAERKEFGFMSFHRTGQST